MPAAASRARCCCSCWSLWCQVGLRLSVKGLQGLPFPRLAFICGPGTAGSRELCCCSTVSWPRFVRDGLCRLWSREKLGLGKVADQWLCSARLPGGWLSRAEVCAAVPQPEPHCPAEDPRKRVGPVLGAALACSGLLEEGTCRCGLLRISSTIQDETRD